MHHLTLHKELRPLGRRPQVRTVQGSRDVSRIPKIFANKRSDGERGEHVECSGDKATVQVAHGIADVGCDAEEEGRARYGRVVLVNLSREQLDVASDMYLEVLRMPYVASALGWLDSVS